jgi:hypothetical protein
MADINTDADELCTHCSEVDLFSLFTGPRHFADNNASTKNNAFALGTLAEIKSNIRCPLCRLVYHDLYRSGLEHPWLFLGDEVDTSKVRIHLWPVRADYLDEMRFVSEETKDLLATKLMVGCTPIEELCSKEEEYTVRHYHRGPGFQLLSPEGVDPKRPLKNGFKVTTGENGLALLKKWLKSCCEEHGMTCESSYYSAEAGAALRKVRVIDSKERKVVEKDLTKIRYASLSYVWGHDQAKYVELGSRVVAENDPVDGWSALLPDEVPTVIEDAMRVCQVLEIPYLWVDLYCVDQFDRIRKSAEINAMGHIYSLSEITFVAAASWRKPPREIFGLRKRQEPSLFPQDGTLPGDIGVQQAVESVQGRKYISARYTIGEQIRDSQWNTRSWTYQEAQLARRIAFFGWDDIAFMCSAGQWREALHSGPYGHEAYLPGIDLRSEGYYMLSFKSWMDSADWKFEDYQSLLMVYTTRELSNESDKLNAICGCLNLIAQKKGVFFHWGLPSKDFHYALLWRGEYDKLRDGFPSWSWAAWHCLQNMSWIYPHQGGGGGAFVEGEDGEYHFQPPETQDTKITFSWYKLKRFTQELASISLLKSSPIIRINSEVAHFWVDIVTDISDPESFVSKEESKLKWLRVPDAFDSTNDRNFPWQLEEEYRTPFARMRLRDSSGNVSVYHYPRWYDHAPPLMLRFPMTLRGSTFTWLLRDGIDLIKIVELDVLESGVASGPFDVVLCLGFDRTGGAGVPVKRMGMFVIPKEVWDRAQPQEETVEMG